MRFEFDCECILADKYNFEKKLPRVVILFQTHGKIKFSHIINNSNSKTNS